MSKFFVLVFILIHIHAIGQKDIFEKGKIVDSVEVKNSSESYSLYVPTKFNKNKLSAIVFIFDPAARGKIGIKPFVAAAERYNYILVCSNNCRNGPFDDNFERIDRLFETVFNTFNIDENLVYTAGFSGGSRLAATVAVLTNQIQGVIGCGAGFSLNWSHLPSNEEFSYVGLVGDTDMNYQEMFGVKQVCSKFKISHEVFTYDDGHNWPPSNQILRAFDWLELESYRKGVKPINNLVVKNAYRKNYDAAMLLEGSNQFELSVWEYERIVKNYSGYLELDSIVLKIKELKKNKTYKAQVKTRQSVKEKEGTILGIFIEKFYSELEIGRSKDNYKWWRREFKKMNDKYVKSGNIYLKKMGERISYTIFAMAFESARDQIRINRMDKAVYCHTLNTVLFPERAHTYYRLARDYALLQEEESMLLNLKIAIDKGLNDKEHLLKTKEFKNYLNNKEFKKVINSI